MGSVSFSAPVDVISLSSDLNCLCWKVPAPLKFTYQFFLTPFKTFLGLWTSDLLFELGVDFFCSHLVESLLHSSYLWFKSSSTLGTSQLIKHHILLLPYSLSLLSIWLYNYIFRFSPCPICLLYALYPPYILFLF